MTGARKNLAPPSQFKPGIVGKQMTSAALASASKFKQLSLREAGQFDRKFHTPEQVAKITRKDNRE